MLSKRQTIFSYKLHLLVTMSGVILGFALAPANATDLQVGVDLLSNHTDLTVLGDKAYISAYLYQSFARQVELLTDQVLGFLLKLA